MKKYLQLIIISAVLPAMATAQVVNINNGLQLVAKGTVALVVDNGGIKNDGIFIPDSSTVYFDGPAGIALSGTQPTNFFNATFRGTGTKRNENENTVAVYNILAAEGATTLDADGSSNNRTFVLRSVPASTASVAILPPTVDITGKVTVERYIPARRSWRLLTAPIHPVSNLTISQAWQEGVSNASRLSPVNPSPGYGTNITKSTVYASDGYDQGSTNNPSIKYYTGSSWGGVPLATNGTTPGANNGLINDQQGYMLFVRGDRSIQVAGTNVVPVNATLRPAGRLKTGTQPAVACNGWTVIGNPYASSINFHKLVSANPGLPEEFYLWEPDLTGINEVGGWISYGAYNAGTQTYTVAPLLPGSSSATNTGDIPSGSAFMVNYTGNIVFTESCKSTEINNALFRPAGELRVNLLAVNTNATVSLNDGVAVLFNAGSETERVTVPKNRNFAEIITINTTKPLAIEKRMAVRENDTVFLGIWQMQRKEYMLELVPGALSIPPHITAFLEDTYLHNYEPVAPHDTTLYRFSVTADSGSFAAARFRIIFKRAIRPFSIRALLQPQNHISVKWEMPETRGLVGYQIEKSSDGKEFVVTGSRQSAANAPAQLEWVDAAPWPNETYYRVKYFTENGGVVYSNIAKVSIKNTGSISVYPNPVTNNRITLQMNGQPEGEYYATLTGSSGQVIFTGKWYHTGTTNTRVLEISPAAAKGIYQLEITQSGSKRSSVISVNVQ